MSYSIIALPIFRKKLKQLAKKYPSLKTDLAILFESLEANPIQ
jgi:mRNA-degrading endonuclease RelE of RelBE toxin-antitoxin system